MKSTGEVMGIDFSFAAAFAKAELAASTDLPLRGRVFISVRDDDKPLLEPIVRGLSGMGFTLIATGGTARYIERLGLACEPINKVAQGSPHTRSDARRRYRLGDQYAGRSKALPIHFRFGGPRLTCGCLFSPRWLERWPPSKQSRR